MRAMRAGYDGMGGRRDGYGIRAVLATLLASACLAAFAASAAEPFRIVTLNVEILTAPGVQAGELQKYRWDEARRAQFERVASLIEALEPDVFNLLEATSREAVDLLVELLHAKGLTSYRGYHVECHDTYTGMDVAVIARRPLDEVDGASIRTFYSEADDPTWRHAYAAPGKTGSPIRQTASLSRNGCYLMTVGGHKLGFLGLHLKSNPSDAYSNAQREAQAEIARRIVRQEIAGRGYLPILLGDFNDFDPETPDRDDERETSTQVLALLKDYDPSRPGPESFNAARHIVRKEDRYTSHWDRNENGVEDPYDVFTMIDHVLLPNELAGCVRRAFIFHNLDLRTTDHRGVVVDLLLP